MLTNKPIIFISHAVTDKPIAVILKSEIDQVFASGVRVFVSSIPGAITPGKEWLRSINNNLKNASAIIVLITPTSINRPWLWFEIGASWQKLKERKGKLYPICVPEIKLSELPEPLSRLQAVSLGKAQEIKVFFQTLCDQFGFGNMKGFKGSKIKSKLPKYKELKVASKDLSSGTIYDGPYEGYSEDELKEILDENFLFKEYKDWNNYPSFHNERDKSIFLGKLIHYRDLDQRLELPPGTSKEHLKKVAERYDLIPEQEWENSIRLRFNPMDQE